jgi:GST-like protein
MIDLYTQGTANGRKASIMLEELGLDYHVHAVDLFEAGQFTPEFKALNPNAKIPVIVDSDGPGGAPFTVFESGAILIYLAEKTQSPLLPAAVAARSVVIQWLMFQMANIGPMFGQYHHFHSHAKERIPYAIARYGKEVGRLYDVLDDRLGESAYLAGADYSIVDLANYTWVERFERPDLDLDIGDRASLRRWYDSISARPAVERGMKVPA